MPSAMATWMRLSSTGRQGKQIYTLLGADQPYRVYIEQMQEGAVTLSSDGLILYTNLRFADMVGVPLTRIIGDVDSKLSADGMGKAPSRF